MRVASSAPRQLCHHRQRHGVLRQAPAFGEVDYQLLIDEQARFHRKARAALICASPDGNFTAEPLTFKAAGSKTPIAISPVTCGIAGCFVIRIPTNIHSAGGSERIRSSNIRAKVGCPHDLDVSKTTSRIRWLPTYSRRTVRQFLGVERRLGICRATSIRGTPLPIWQCRVTGKFEAVSELLASCSTRASQDR